MAFVKKEWLQRIVDFPGRRKLTPTGMPNTYDVTRDEGTIIQPGDNLSAANMNDLEERIYAGIEERILKSMIVQNALSTNPDTVASGPVAKDLQDQINEQNNNLAEVDYSSEITLLNGATIGRNRLMLVKRGKRVMLNAYITLPTPSSSDIMVMRVPLSCCPSAKSESAFSAVNFGGTAGTVPVALWLYTNGEIRVYVPATKTISAIAITMEWWSK